MGMCAFFSPLPASSLDALRDDPDAADAFLNPDDPDGEPAGSFDLDKAWHGLHYLFTGTAWDLAPPLGLAILGGRVLGDEDDDTVARLLEPAEVAQVAAALEALTPATLSARYDPADMDAKEIYPQIWSRDGDDGLDYLLHYFAPLKQGYAEAARRGDAMLLTLG